MKKLIGVGTGPGAADLLTLRAVKAIEEARVVFAPNNRGRNMALDTVKDLISDKELIMVDMPMGRVTRDDYKNAAQLVSRSIPTGASGVYLTIGDPMIYSTFIYLMEELDRLDCGLEIELVPGLPSFVAAASAARLPLCIKGESLLLMDEYDGELVDRVDNLALLKTFKSKGEVLEKLDSQGFSYRYLRKVSLEDEYISDKKEEILEDKSYMSLILARRKGIKR